MPTAAILTDPNEIAQVNDREVLVYFVHNTWEGWDDEAVPTCSICDGIGHGYPGAGPCPLEERGEQGVPWWAQ